MTGHRIRIAQKGWAGTTPARTLDEVTAGLGCWWVEIDGHRFEHVVSVDHLATDDEFTVPRLLVDLIGPVEIVYVDSDGDELPTGTLEVEDDGTIRGYLWRRSGQRLRPGELLECDTLRERYAEVVYWFDQVRADVLRRFRPRVRGAAYMAGEVGVCAGPSWAAHDPHEVTVGEDTPSLMVDDQADARTCTTAGDAEEVAAWARDLGYNASPESGG